MSISDPFYHFLLKAFICLNSALLLGSDICSYYLNRGFPRSSAGKESACSAGVSGSIPGLGRSPGEGDGNPFQYSGLENPMDRGAWRATVVSDSLQPYGLQMPGFPVLVSLPEIAQTHVH